MGSSLDLSDVQLPVVKLFPAINEGTILPLVLASYAEGNANIQEDQNKQQDKGNPRFYQIRVESLRIRGR